MLLYIVLIQLVTSEKACSIKVRLAVVLPLDHTVALQKKLALTI